MAWHINADVSEYIKRIYIKNLLIVTEAAVFFLWIIYIIHTPINFTIMIYEMHISL